MATIFVVERSFDARYLALSSQDGYCTLVEFEKDELGQPSSSLGLLFIHLYANVCPLSFYTFGL